MKAWLITWEWAGEHAKVDEPIAAILNPRYSTDRVRDLVELLYVNAMYSLGERASYAKGKMFNPYPAEYGTIWIGKKLGRYLNRIYCGHNPHLYARQVTDLHVDRTDDGKEVITWKEPPVPSVKE